jgi:hypothetical protein
MEEGTDRVRMASNISSSAITHFSGDSMTLSSVMNSQALSFLI